MDHGLDQILAQMQIYKLYVALDSGAVDHCVNPKDLPDSIMVVKEDEKRRFVNATGEDIDHYGNALVRLKKPDGRHVSSTFQVMDVCRPLHSTSKICDQGCNVVYTDKEAVVIPSGLLEKFLESVTRHATYPRVGGLYVAELHVSTDTAGASPFGGQGQKQ